MLSKKWPRRTLIFNLTEDQVKISAVFTEEERPDHIAVDYRREKTSENKN